MPPGRTRRMSDPARSPRSPENDSARVSRESRRKIGVAKVGRLVRSQAPASPVTRRARRVERLKKRGVAEREVTDVSSFPEAGMFLWNSKGQGEKVFKIIVHCVQYTTFTGGAEGGMTSRSA